ncbi:hypothetical protein [Natrialba asiatica]|uniref:hypothetical protein n=1 Tax=Natrialba asiatica TaxID=64602 RepID=UPI001268748C|nr:hypothetical protein [Natrialba asiatica]
MNNREARLARVAIGNFSSSAVSFEIQIFESESTVYDESMRIEPNSDDDVTVPSFVVEEDLPSEPGAYRIEYGISGSSLEEFDFSNSIDTDCGQVHIDIREADRTEIFVSDSCDTI